MIACSSVSLTPSGVALIGSVANRRASGSRSARGPSQRASAQTGMPSTNFAITSNFVGVHRLQPPAGAMPVTVRARPRLSSSKATQPPSELPTMWAVFQPSSSSCRSTWSASTDELRNHVPA